MKWTTFSIFCIFYLALMLSAERRPAPAAAHEFSAAHDLSTETTILHAPAAAQSNGWTAAQIPPQRLVSPLVLLPARHGHVSLREIVRYEKEHGSVPPGAVVIVNAPRVSFDFEALRFLAEGRHAYGIGATGEVDFIASAPFIAAKGMYVLDHLHLPAALTPRAMLTVAPEKSETAIAPARVLALERAR